MKKYIPLVLAFLIITLTACNKDDSPTAPEVTTTETTTATTSTEPTITTPPTTTTTTAVTTTEPPETTSATTTTTPAPVTTTTPAPPTQAPPPIATNPPPTQAPPPPTTTTATTEPPVAFDPQIYVDYAIEYGKSIGLEYMPDLGNYPQWGGDKPMENAAWNNPTNIAPSMTEFRMRSLIQQHCDALKKEGVKYIRPKIYCADELKWETPYANAKLLFIFWARG